MKRMYVSIALGIILVPLVMSIPAIALNMIIVITWMGGHGIANVLEQVVR